MNNIFLKSASFAILVLLVSVFAVQNQSAYAQWTNAPSFGSGRFHYTDGLVINGKAFDISGYVQKITTQNLPIGKPSQIALKIFDNDGPTTIKGAALFFNIRGPYASVSNSDTWIQYDQRGVYVNDPHHFINKVTAGISVAYPFAYVTFQITPQSPMEISDIGIIAWDERYSSSNTLAVDGLSFS